MTAGVLSRRCRGGIWTLAASILVSLCLLYAFQVQFPWYLIELMINLGLERRIAN